MHQDTPADIFGLRESPREHWTPYPRDEGDRPTSGRSRSSKARGGWVWIPLSFIFLLLGSVLGFQVALSVRSRVSDTPREDPYALNLSATPSADSVHLRWDRQAPVIRQAERGALYIEEAGSEKIVDLDIGHLRHGSVIYRKGSNDVRFRMEVFVKDKSSVSETLQFHLPAGR
ncbi:MAG: hypothetical protein KIT09_30960 [Bryobacteraceae bacterium]|nr:hypothetical protein [Bryobacteraceae bacterium]